MRFTMTVMAALMATATAATAMKATDLDIDGDGFASLGELRQIFPGFSSNDFRDIDVNRDRRLSKAELNAAGTSAHSSPIRAWKDGNTHRLMMPPKRTVSQILTAICFKKDSMFTEKCLK